MIVVMKPGSTQQQVDHVVGLVNEMGLKDHVIVGTERTVVAVIGNDRMKDRSAFETVPGVDKVVPILAPYKMASREVKKDRSTVPLGGRTAGRRRGPGRRHRRAVQRREQAADAGDRPRRQGGRARSACGAGRSSRGRARTPSRAWASRG